MTFLSINFCYITFGDIMKVRVFDESHEKDLEEAINNFVEDEEPKILDIKFSVAIGVFSEEQVFCFSALILYE